MPDSPAIPIVVAARIGRTEIGQALLSFEDDAMLVVVRDGSNERVVRVDLASVEGVYAEAREVIIPLRDGTRLILIADESIDLRETLLGKCMALPELTRTLRTFGSRRGTRGRRDIAGDEQRRFFAPLLDARRIASGAPSPDETITAFDADALVTSIHRVLQAFAAQRFAQLGPERRALEAELFDAVEPLQDSLKRVRDAAPRARAAAGELRPWRMWAAEVRASFEAADRVWVELDGVLEAVPVPQPKDKSAK